MKIFPDVTAGPPMYRGDRPNVRRRCLVTACRSGSTLFPPWRVFTLLKSAKKMEKSNADGSPKAERRSTANSGLQNYQ